FCRWYDTATSEIYTLALHDALPISTGTDHDVESTGRRAGNRRRWNLRARGVDLRRRAAGRRAGRFAALVLVPLATGRYSGHRVRDRKSTRLNSSHVKISYAVFCLKK